MDRRHMIVNVQAIDLSLPPPPFSQADVSYMLLKLRRLQKTYKKVKAKDSTIKHHLDEGKHLWQEVNTLLSVARPSSADALRRMGIATSAPVTPMGTGSRTPASPSSDAVPRKRSAREIMFGTQTPPSSAPTRRAWDTTTPAESPLASPAWADDDTTPGMVPLYLMNLFEEEDESSSSVDPSAGNSSRRRARPSSAQQHSPHDSISNHRSRLPGPYRQYHAFS